jgi:hypothetical protein
VLGTSTVGPPATPIIFVFDRACSSRSVAMSFQLFHMFPHGNTTIMFLELRACGHIFD